jgi:hypothetical protein
VNQLQDSGTLGDGEAREGEGGMTQQIGASDYNVYILPTIGKLVPEQLDKMWVQLVNLGENIQQPQCVFSLDF